MAKKILRGNQHVLVLSVEDPGWHKAFSDQHFVNTYVHTGHCGADEQPKNAWYGALVGELYYERDGAETRRQIYRIKLGTSPILLLRWSPKIGQVAKRESRS